MSPKKHRTCRDTLLPICDPAIDELIKIIGPPERIGPDGRSGDRSSSSYANMRTCDMRCAPNISGVLLGLLALLLCAGPAEGAGAQSDAGPDTSKSAPASSYTVDYSYDTQGRLTKAEYTSSEGLDFQYDAAGNLTAADPVVAIPVELAGINAQTTGENTVRLTWQTASEQDNAGFAVQRKRGRERGSGGEWEEVGWVDGSGTTQKPQTYRFEDAEVPFSADTLAYRLRQVDIDGREELSEVVRVGLGLPDRLSLRAPFPNPARQQATLRMEVPETTDLRVALYDLLGRRVQAVADGRYEAGRHEWQMNLSGLPSGTYFLRLEAEGTVQAQKLTVVR